MQCVVLLSMVLAFSAVYVQAESDVYETFDIDALIKNPAAMKEFLACFAGKGPCSPIAATFQKDIPGAVTTACANCSKAQKIASQKFIGALKDQYPEEFEAFKKAIDPEGKYFAALEAGIAKV